MRLQVSLDLKTDPSQKDVDRLEKALMKDGYPTRRADERLVGSTHSRSRPLVAAPYRAHIIATAGLVRRLRALSRGCEPR